MQLSPVLNYVGACNYAPLTCQVPPLLGVLRSLRLELWALKQEETAYKALLGLVSSAFFRHAGPCAQMFIERERRTVL